MTTTIPICVVGAGTMGRGIAQIALAAGHRVSLVDPQEDQLHAARQEISKRLARRRPELAAALGEHLGTFTSIEATPPDSDTLVIEAVLESLDVKTAVFQAAAAHFGHGCVLATNTSSLSVTAIAAGTPVPERVVGMHFFNPVPVMKLVEVVSGVQTEPAIADQIADLATSWGKQVARVKSAPGFIVNRVARGFYGEALRLVEEQVSSPATVDEVIRGAGFRMGPFELMDLIGNDVNAAVTRSVWTAFNFDRRFEPSRIQDELVAAGHYGRKRGHGFYSYADDAEPGKPVAVPPSDTPEKVVLTGDCGQLSTLLSRSAVEVDRVSDSDSAGPAATLPNEGIVVVVTRGRTAHQESAVRDGAPVVVIDRCVDAGAATSIAAAASHPGTPAAVAGLLAAAGVDVYEVDDVPGLVVARTLAVIANEAWETALHGVATPDDIDVAMELGTNYPVGPFAWTRDWGSSTVLELLDQLWSTYHDTRYRANRLLRSAATS
ncbi:3-hydroxyacyl-CoA dehydrogenase [Nocardioides sp. NPDC023903]|uniref:3-hydroxyacyl-CoA dehydrogenase n=1 Tax=Nocardioides sp. NPDC023903 TaxID=3157195 RepID=UPI0034091B36